MTEKGIILEQRGDDFVKQARYSKALQAYRESLKLQAHDDFTQDAPTLEALFEKVGNIEIIHAQYRQSCDSYQHALDNRLTNNSPGIGALMGKWFSNCGQREHEIGRYVNALGYFRKAHDSYTQSKSSNEEDILAAIDLHKAVAKVLFYQNAYQTALQSLENAQTDYVASKLTDCYVLAEIHCLRGDVYVALCQYDLGRVEYQLTEKLLREAEAKSVTGALHLSIARLAIELCNFDAASRAIKGAKMVYNKLFPDNPSSVGMALTLSTCGYLSFRKGDYRQARFLYQQSMAMLSTAFGEDAMHPYRANAIENEGIVLMKLGEYRTAIVNFRSAACIRQKVFELASRKHIDVAKAWDCEAEALSKLGWYNDALNLHENALALKAEVLKESCEGESDEIARSYTMMGDIYTLQNNFHEAEKCYQKSIATQKKIYANTACHVNIVDNLCKLSKVYTMLRRYDTALTVAYEGYSMCNELRNLGARPHIHTDPIIRVAEIYDERGMTGKASDLYEQAVKIRSEILGASHPDVADALTRLGTLQVKTIEFNQGVNNLKRALNMYFDIYNDVQSHPDIAFCFECLANGHFASQKFLQALECYTKALVVYKESYGDIAHPDIARCLRGIGMSYLEEGLSLDSARVHLCQSREMFSYIFGAESNHLEIAKCWYSFGNLELALKNNAEALKAYMNCIKMHQAIQLVRSPIWSDIMHRVGRAFDLQGACLQALSFYRECLSINRELAKKREQSFKASDIALLAKIGKSEFRIGDYKKAKKTLTVTLAFLKHMADKKADFLTLEASINYMLGKIEEGVGENAEEYFDLSKRQCTQLRCNTKQLRLLYQRLAVSAAEDGKFEESNSLLCQALCEMRIESCENYKDRCQAVFMLDRMGDNFYALGRYEAALKRYTEALNITQQFSKEQTLALAHSHRRLGLVFERLGKYSDSHEHFLTSKIYFERVYGQKIHPDLFLAKAHIGFALTNLDLLEEAGQCLQESFDNYQSYMAGNISKIVSKKSGVEVSCGFLQTYLRYSGLYHFKTGNYKLAAKILCDAYHFCLTYSITSLDKPLIVYNLGLALKKQMRLPESLEIMEDALLEWKEYFTQHPDMADCYHHIGEIQEQLRRYDEALVNYDIAYTMKNKFVPTDVKAEIAYYEDMVSLSRNKRDWCQCLKHLEKLAVKKSLIGGKDDIAETLKEIANMYSLLGDEEKQEIFDDEARAAHSFKAICPIP